MKRFWVAIAAYAALAILACTTLSDEKLRLATLAILGLFALKTVLFRKHTAQASSGE